MVDSVTFGALSILSLIRRRRLWVSPAASPSSGHRPPDIVLFTRLGTRDHEVFAAILLDTQRRLIEYVELFQGGLDSTSIYARELVKYVISSRASAVIIAHNHSSGSTEPSLGDRAVTVRLQQALKLIDVKLMDHLIFGKTIVSMRDRGVLG